uniref:Uncharacterized protein n=1 Tax=Chromera velia CCMP2878 TaxID=1169474 RepID=A0A0G4HLG5_9ALVE|eukprot:Cvel_7336.t1-p1 / transcript=Cvel_7336.t1 / gene=Cvel_7336 / organism=Chromera_velia_CCMP2878 / gene_product=hypothetical protein / transcript_product=hypothetical protein / location=Cvel_scaffold380:45710-49281(+) / protein_length=474 / sequence_SO=supercontig / SO=protein_coding / is_pseudo=false
MRGRDSKLHGAETVLPSSRFSLAGASEVAKRIVLDRRGKEAKFNPAGAKVEGVDEDEAEQEDEAPSTNQPASSSAHASAGSTPQSAPTDRAGCGEKEEERQTGGEREQGGQETERGDKGTERGPGETARGGRAAEESNDGPTEGWEEGWAFWDQIDLAQHAVDDLRIPTERMLPGKFRSRWVQMFSKLIEMTCSTDRRTAERAWKAVIYFSSLFWRKAERGGAYSDKQTAGRISDFWKELVRQPVCGCGQRGDLEGVHGGKCPRGEGLWRRYQKVGAAFFELLTGVRYCMVGGEMTIGSLGLDLTGPLAKEHDKRPDLFATLRNGDSVLGDVALIHPIQDATRLHRNAKKAGAAAKDKEGKKYTHYDDACRAVGIHFVPLVFETYRRPGGETVRFVKEMVRQATERLEKMNNVSAHQKIADRWWKTLSVAVQKAVASTILASVQASRGARSTQVTKMLLGREFSAYVGLTEKKE